MALVKDKIIFCSKSDHEKPSKYEPPAPLESEQNRGALLPNGEINWTCPCLGKLPYGPCGFEFRQFFGCLHKESDQEEPAKKTEECFPQFEAMKGCFSQFPKLYPAEDYGGDGTSA